MPTLTYPKQGSMGQIRTIYCFLKKKKQRKTVKVLPHLAFILITDNCPTTKIKKIIIICLVYSYIATHKGRPRNNLTYA